jgi:broad specificity phosphatase PhoE
MVEAWLQGRYDYEGERWEDFHGRVTGCREALAAAGRDANIVVFTSAAPIGIWTALSMDICDGRAMRLAGGLQNASCTVLRLHGEQLRLHSFNGIAHLPTPELRTYR